MKRVFNEKNGYTGFLSNSQLYFAGAAAGIANSAVSGKYIVFYSSRLSGGHTNECIYIFFIGPVEHIRTRKPDLSLSLSPTLSELSF